MISEKEKFFDPRKPFASKRPETHEEWQVLVWQDMLGLNGDKVPKFVRCFAPVGQTMTQAFRAYDREVKAGAFPAVSETYAQSDCGDDVLARLEQNNAAFPAAVI